MEARRPRVGLVARQLLRDLVEEPLPLGWVGVARARGVRCRALGRQPQRGDVLGRRPQIAVLLGIEQDGPDVLADTDAVDEVSALAGRDDLALSRRSLTRYGRVPRTMASTLAGLPSACTTAPRTK